MANAHSVQPLALVHNDELVYIEENDQTIQRKFSCFKIFKLKGPIDINYLLDIIFPPFEKRHYGLEISDYNGRSAKLKFNFTNRTHADLIRHLQNATEKFYDISENGLVDWLASDTNTFKTIYQNTDMTAIQQLRDTNATDSYDNSTTSSTSSTLTQLYPIVDEEAFERELDELRERIASQTDHDLERIFRNTFQRRDLTITIQSLSSEFFSQIGDIVTFIGSDKSLSAINENFMSDSNTIVHHFSRQLFKQAEHYINANSLTRLGTFVNNYKFGIVLTLWNLINAFNSIHASYKVLLDTDVIFEQILKSQKSDFMNFLSNMDKSLMDLLIILDNEIDVEKYERLQRRLTNFVEAAENLMNIVMITNNKCNEELETLENQQKGLTNKLVVAAITIGISAFVIGGFLYNNSRKRKLIIANAANAASAASASNVANIANAANVSNAASAANSVSKQGWIGGALALAGGLFAGKTMMDGYSTRSKLQSAIEKQTNVLDQLQSTHSKLLCWKNLGKIYIERDIDDMNNNRMTLVDEFVKIRLQCKCLCEIFDSLE